MKSSITNAEINKAMRIILDTIQDDPSFVFLQDEDAGVYLIPAVMSKDSTEDANKIGAVQWQVSNVPRGDRGESFDFWEPLAAIHFYKDVKRSGWKLALSRLK